MNYQINYFKEKVVIKYHKNVVKDELKFAFLDITEIADFEILKYIVHDFSTVESYVNTNVENYIEKANLITHFYATWNTNIKIITIATNTEIRTMFSEIIKNSKKLIWEHFLFENWDSVQNWKSDI